MITIDGKQLRNLVEQVLKNKQDIADHWAVDRVLADFGIKIIGQVDTWSEPEGEFNYGDAYAVGTEPPYDIYIYTRADINAGHEEDYWLDIGPIAIIGPEGKQGERGPKGDKGDKGDKGAKGDTGATGPAGPIGPQGQRGIQGPQGIPGENGTPGDAVQIIGILSTVSELPDPASVARNAAYIITDSDTGSYIYFITGTTNLVWSHVPFENATTVISNGQHVEIFNADTKLDKRANNVGFNSVYYEKASNGGTGLMYISTDANFDGYRIVGTTSRSNSAANTPLYGGAVICAGEPDKPRHVATKNYVDYAKTETIGSTGWHSFGFMYDAYGFDQGWQGFFIGITYNTVLEWIGDIAWVWDTTTGPNTGEFFNATINQGSLRFDGNGNWNLVGIVQDAPMNQTAQKYIKNGVIKMSGTSDKLSAVGGGMIDTGSGIIKYSMTNYTAGFAVAPY